MLLNILFILTSYATSTLPDYEIGCTHKAVCTLLEELGELNRTTIIPKAIAPGDRKFDTIPYMVVHPVDLDNSIEKAVYSRVSRADRKGFKTTKLFLPSNKVKLYKIKSTIPAKALSHFWLYPDITCMLEQQIIGELKGEIGIRHTHCEQHKSRMIRLGKALRDVQLVKLSMPELIPLFRRFYKKTELVQSFTPLIQIHGKASKFDFDPARLDPGKGIQRPIEQLILALEQKK